MIGFYNYTVFPTYLGFASGMLGLFFALRGKPLWAVFCLMAAGVFDMFDGKIAKTRERTDPEKKFGIQIDSLSDFVCFGVLPAAIGYAVGMQRLPYVIVLIVFSLAALIRLAYFNVMEEERQAQTTETRKEYEGLPVTTVALIIPFLYIFRKLLVRTFGNGAFVLVYALALVWLAALFLMKFKIKKPGLKVMLVFVAVGLTEMLLLIPFGMR